MANIREVNFALKVTRVHRKSIDKLVTLADSFRKSNLNAVITSLEGEDDIDNEALYWIGNHSILDFSLFALAIIHCYSIVENSRKLMLQGIPNLSSKEIGNLHKIETVSLVLEKQHICHKMLRCYKTMDEFRLVNNAIKHQRFGLSRVVTTREGKGYGAKQLRSLYLNRAKHLESYLSDMYERVVGPNPAVHRTLRDKAAQRR